VAGHRGGMPVCRSRPLEAAHGGRRLSRNCRAPRGIKPAAVITADDGRPYLAEVIGHDGARVRVWPVTGPRHPHGPSRDVVGHWRRAGPTRGPGAGFAPIDVPRRTSPPNGPPCAAHFPSRPDS
jgi:hypothetical protein